MTRIVHNTKKSNTRQFYMTFVCTCTYTLNDMSYKIKYTSKINIETGLSLLTKKYMHKCYYHYMNMPIHEMIMVND